MGWRRNGATKGDCHLRGGVSVSWRGYKVRRKGPLDGGEKGRGAGIILNIPSQDIGSGDSLTWNNAGNEPQSQPTESDCGGCSAVPRIDGRSKFSRRLQKEGWYSLKVSNRYRCTNVMVVLVCKINCRVGNVDAKVPSTVGINSRSRQCPAPPPRRIHRRPVSTPQGAPRCPPSRTIRHTPLLPTQS